MSWDAHLDLMQTKVEKRMVGLWKVLRIKYLSARAKLLIWLSSVRPLLEYGCEVWRLNTSQIAKLESIQTTAAKKILRINAKSSNAAVLALMHAPNLRTRHDAARLKYVAKVMAMDKGRLARAVILRKPNGPARPRRVADRHWWPETMRLIDADPILRAAYAKLKGAVDRNQGVAPLDLDPTLDHDCSPVQMWIDTIDEWAKRKSYEAFSEKAEDRPTLLVMKQALAEELMELPVYQLTRRPIVGPNQIRLRLLTGTSALNATLSKSTGRSPACPFVSCGGSKEDTQHFLLHCKGLSDLRDRYRTKLGRSCSCARRIGSGGEVGCAEFLEGLDDAQAALFMLGEDR